MNGLALETVSIARVEALRTRHGARFAERWFTAPEQAYCEPRRLAGQHYAARLAAKLAVRRLLGPVRLRDIEVVRDEAGAPSLRLHGTAALRGRGARLHVSLSHDGGIAVALVVGESVGESVGE